MKYSNKNKKRQRHTKKRQRHTKKRHTKIIGGIVTDSFKRIFNPLIPKINNKISGVNIKNTGLLYIYIRNAINELLEITEQPNDEKTKEIVSIIQSFISITNVNYIIRNFDALIKINPTFYTDQDIKDIININIDKIEYYKNKPEYNGLRDHRRNTIKDLFIKLYSLYEYLFDVKTILTEILENKYHYITFSFDFLIDDHNRRTDIVTNSIIVKKNPENPSTFYDNHLPPIETATYKKNTTKKSPPPIPLPPINKKKLTTAIT